MAIAKQTNGVCLFVRVVGVWFGLVFILLYLGVLMPNNNNFNKLVVFSLFLMWFLTLC